MKTKLIPILALISGFSTLNSYAQEHVGNGGDAIVCKDKIMMLDSYEAVSGKIKWPVSLGGPNLSVRAKVEIALKRIWAKDESLYEQLSVRSNELLNDIENFEATKDPFQPNITFKTDTLANIPDEGAASYPTDCKLLQLISQTPKPFPGHTKYEFQRTLWESKLFDNDQRAVAVMHEAIYGYLMNLKLYNSPMTRYINEAAISKKLESLNLGGYLELLKQIGAPQGRLKFQGFTSVSSFPESDISLDEQGNLKSIRDAEVSDSTPIELPTFFTVKARESLKFYDLVTFDLNGWKSLYQHYARITYLDSNHKEIVSPFFNASTGELFNLPTHYQSSAAGKPSYRVLKTVVKKLNLTDQTLYTLNVLDPRFTITKNEAVVVGARIELVEPGFLSKYYKIIEKPECNLHFKLNGEFIRADCKK